MVGESPSPYEVAAGATALGPAGREVRQALTAGGFPSEQASYTNALLCRPPNGDLEALLRKCKKEGLPSPIDCCKPHLEAELSQVNFALYVGGSSVKAAGAGESVMKLRGTPLKGPPQGLATLHPGFVMQDSGKVMRGVFRFDVAKAARLARGGNTWVDPAYTVLPNVHGLEVALAKLHGPIACDTETDGVDPWKCRIRRVGLTDGQTSVIWSPLSVHGHEMGDTAAGTAILARFFAQPRPWYFHNFYAYDSIVLAQHGMVVNEENLFDSLIGHHIGPTSELPHKLDFLGSIYTDAPRWKDDVKHSTTRSDEILDRYLSFDLAVTHVAGPIVFESLRQANQDQIYRLDAGLAVVGRSMSALGVQIDQAKRAAFVDEYELLEEKHRGAFIEAAGREINPGSVPALKRLFYHDFGLPVLDEYRTDTGEPSTGEPVLLDLLARGLDERASRTIQALLGWREADKILGTYVGRKRTKKIKAGKSNGRGLPNHTDGRTRVTWKVHGTTSGRWSSSPNLQNIPDKLRAMFVPAVGNAFVAADFSAIELRILALLAGDAPFIQAFAEMDAGTGPDVHTFNACALFGCTPDKVTKEVRNFVKRFTYGLSYGAGPPTIFKTLSLLRNDDLSPMFPGLTLNEIERVYKKWWDAHPAIVAWRTDTIRGWRRNGFIATSWHGRKRYFIGGENHEEMYNHPIQGAAADVQNESVLMLTTRYPFDYTKRRGLVLQVHDQLVVECGEHETDRVKGLLRESMEKAIGSMRFPAETKTGKTWKDV